MSLFQPLKNSPKKQSYWIAEQQVKDHVLILFSHTAL